MNNNERILTCVYCGHEYSQETPSWNNEVLTEHIKICEKHPMRKAEENIERLVFLKDTARGKLCVIIDALSYQVNNRDTPDVDAIKMQIHNLTSIVNNLE